MRRDKERPPVAPVRLAGADFQALETIRGLAAFYVVLNHSRGWLWAGGRYLQSHSVVTLPMKLGIALDQLTRLGYEAVILFFVLSGFSIAHSVSKASSPMRFYKRRFWRLYPPYVTALLWAMAVFWVTRRLTPDLYDGSYALIPFTSLHRSLGFLSRRTILHNLLYRPLGAPISQFWSLPLEVVFYALAPLLMKSRKAFAGAALLGWLAGIWIPPRRRVFQFVLHYGLYFAAGVAAHSLYPRLQNLVHSARPGTLYSFIAACFVAMLGLSYPYPTGRPGELVAVAMAIVAIPLCIKLKGGPRALQWLGEQSYTLYLTHLATVLLVMSVMHRCGLAVPVESPWVWPVAVPFSLLVSSVFYRAVEARTRVWLARARQTPAARA